MPKPARNLSPLLFSPPKNPSAPAKPAVTIYTDGGCSPNPGPGGYGVVLLFQNQRCELSGGFKRTTNNRMEIFAAIAALERLNTSCVVTLFCDSRYVVDAISLGWAAKWKRKNWWRNKEERAVNPDLWERLLIQCSRHDVNFVWVRGHAGNVENERCDVLSAEGRRPRNLPPDTGYEEAGAHVTNGKTSRGSAANVPKPVPADTFLPIA